MCMCGFFFFHLRWVVPVCLQDTSPNESDLEVKPSTVPNCLVSHLSYMHIKGYQGDSSEMEFASYVLQNGLVLKKMIISGVLLDQKKKWEKYRCLSKFSNMPRGSAVCQVTFDWAISTQGDNSSIFVICWLIELKRICSLHNHLSFLFFSFYDCTTFSTMLDFGGIAIHTPFPRYINFQPRYILIIKPNLDWPLYDKPNHFNFALVAVFVLISYGYMLTKVESRTFKFHATYCKLTWLFSTACSC